MMDLTVLLIPGISLQEHPVFLGKTLCKLDAQTIFLKNKDFNRKVKTKWKLFLYTDERLDQGLIDALPVCITQEQIDFFVIYSKVGKNDFRYFESPRLFKSSIDIRGDCVYPVESDKWKWVNLLDGFILR